MNFSDMYYLKLNLTLLSLNINDFQKSPYLSSNKNLNNQKNIDKSEPNEVIIDNNFTTEKMNSLLSKLNISTFSKSNSSLMCQIIYFLIMSYDAAQFSDTLRLCYPVITLNDLKIFKETAYSILSSILPPIILCGKSLLDEAYGIKIEKFLRNFSDFVISSKITSYTNKKNVVYDQLLTYKNNRNNSAENKNMNNILLNIRKNCLITQISNLKESIVEKLKKINDIQNKWKNSASSISKELEKENEKHKKLKNKYNSIINGNKSRFSEISSLDRAPKIENHSQFVKMVDGLHQRFIEDEEFKNNIDYINSKENQEIIDSLNSKVILNNNKILGRLNDGNVNVTKSINSNIDVSKDKKELETLINELKEKKENTLAHKEGELFVLHELVNTLDQRIKEDNQKFNERNINKENKFESNTANLGVTLDEQIDKLKNIEKNIDKLKSDLNIK